MPIHLFTPPYFCFNNFSAHAIEFEGKLYPTSEHAYQAAKFADAAIIEAIRTAPSPMKAKKLANETYESVQLPDWETRRVAVMEAVLRAKSKQHSDVAKALSDSGKEEIVEIAFKNRFWGANKEGEGQNMLGKLWMKIRDEQ